MTSSDHRPPATDNYTGSRDGNEAYDVPAIKPVGYSGPEPRHPLKWWIAGLLVLILAFGMWKYPEWKATAEAGTAYGARVGCSCRFVQGRDIKSCETDFEPGMSMVSLSEDAEAKRVTASVPFMATRSAHYAGETGCLLDPE